MTYRYGNHEFRFQHMPDGSISGTCTACDWVLTLEAGTWRQAELVWRTEHADVARRS